MIIKLSGRTKLYVIIVLVLIVVLISLVLLFLPYKVISVEDKRIVQNSNTLKVYDSGKLIWKSDKDYKVSDFVVGDIDQDGQKELAVVLWKRGYYGPTLPFWQEENIDDYGNHLFIYELTPEIKIKWGSSTIPYTLEQIDFKDKQLVVNQNEYWEWEGFGFTRVK